MHSEDRSGFLWSYFFFGIYLLTGLKRCNFLLLSRYIMVKSFAPEADVLKMVPLDSLAEQCGSGTKQTSLTGCCTAKLGLKAAPTSGNPDVDLNSVDSWHERFFSVPYRDNYTHLYRHTRLLNILNTSVQSTNTWQYHVVNGNLPLVDSECK